MNHQELQATGRKLNDEAIVALIPKSSTGPIHLSAGQQYWVCHGSK
jgi:hypothetical protein